MAALNLSVRCSVTAVDPCGAALGRLSGLSAKDAWFDAGDIRQKCRPAALADQRLAPLATAYLARVKDQAWLDTEALRHEATHRQYRRGVYASIGQRPEPRPLAHPQQLDIAHKGWGMHPLDQLSVLVDRYAEATFRGFCGTLTALS